MDMLVQKTVIHMVPYKLLQILINTLPANKDAKILVIIQHKLFSSNPIKFLTGFSLNFFRIQPVSDSAQSTALFAPSELFWQHRNTGAYPRV